MEKNRTAVKNVFLQMDDPQIQKFIAENGYALGLESGSGNDSTKRWLAMWE